jgi:hypothetical protein
MNCKTLQIEATSETALFKCIRFTFAPDSFCFIHAKINLEDGHMPAEPFVVVGAVKVEFLLNKQAFE